LLNRHSNFIFKFKMTTWEGRVYEGRRSIEDSKYYDQEFGKPDENELDDSGFVRSRTTYHKDTFERDDGTETYLHSESRPISKGRTFSPSRAAKTEKSRSQNRNKDVRGKPPKKAE
jgi:hypothetical protein